MNPWQELTPSEAALIWQRLRDAFAFSPVPGADSDQDCPDWRMPMPSVIYAQSTPADDIAARHTLHAALLQALRRCVAPGGRVYALAFDLSFWFLPHEPFEIEHPAADEALDAWRLQLFDERDSSTWTLFLAEDASFGFMSDSCSGALWCFGQPLLDTLAQAWPDATALVRDGQAVLLPERPRDKLIAIVWAAVLVCGLPLCVLFAFGFSRVALLGLVLGGALGLLVTVTLYVPWASTWQAAYGWQGAAAAQQAWQRKARIDNQWHYAILLLCALLCGGVLLLINWLLQRFGDALIIPGLTGLISGLLLGIFGLVGWLTRKASQHATPQHQ